MQDRSYYSSPLGELVLTADELGLTGLRFIEDKDKAAADGSFDVTAERREHFAEARLWLDRYFSGRDPGFTPQLHLQGTAFRRDVWNLLLKIPFGVTVSYGQVAARITSGRGRKTSARAVGQAVGANPIALIVPCHRVIGSDGSLTGYAFGVERKKALLRLEEARDAE